MPRLLASLAYPSGESLYGSGMERVLLALMFAAALIAAGWSLSHPHATGASGMAEALTERPQTAQTPDAAAQHWDGNSEILECGSAIAPEHVGPAAIAGERASVLPRSAPIVESAWPEAEAPPPRA